MQFFPDSHTAFVHPSKQYVNLFLDGKREEGDYISIFLQKPERNEIRNSAEIRLIVHFKELSLNRLGSIVNHEDKDFNDLKKRIETFFFSIVQNYPLSYIKMEFLWQGFSENAKHGIKALNIYFGQFDFFEEVKQGYTPETENKLTALYKIKHNAYEHITPFIASIPLNGIAYFDRSGNPDNTTLKVFYKGALISFDKLLVREDFSNFETMIQEEYRKQRLKIATRNNEEEVFEALEVILISSDDVHQKTLSTRRWIQSAVPYSKYRFTDLLHPLEIHTFLKSTMTHIEVGEFITNIENISVYEEEFIRIPSIFSKPLITTTFIESDVLISQTVSNESFRTPFTGSFINGVEKIKNGESTSAIHPRLQPVLKKCRLLKRFELKEGCFGGHIVWRNMHLNDDEKSLTAEEINRDFLMIHLVNLVNGVLGSANAGMIDEKMIRVVENYFLHD